MNFTFDSSFYSEEHDGELWVNFSPWLIGTPQEKTLSGTASLPIDTDKLNAVLYFIEEVVLRESDRQLKVFFPNLVGNKDSRTLVGSKERLRFLYANFIFDWEGAGETTIKTFESLTLTQGWSRDQFLLLLRDISISSFFGDNEWAYGMADSAKAFSTSDSVNPIDPSLMVKIEALVHLAARFSALTGQETTPFADLLKESEDFQPLTNLFTQIGALTGKGILRDESQSWSASVVLERIFQRLSERDLDILSSRMFADTPESLQSIGVRYEVTRERIRQLESIAKKQVIEHFMLDPLMQDLSKYTRNAIHMMRPLEELLDKNAFLSEIVPSVGEAVWRVLDRLDDSFEIDDEWCFVPDRESVEKYIEENFLAKKDQYGVIPLSDATFITVGESGQRDIYLDKWVKENRFSTYGEYLITSMSSFPDRAAAILSIEGRALSIDEIFDKLPEARNRAGLRDRFHSDPRLVRADKDSWALSEWDVPEYAPIRRLIKSELEKAGGELSLDTLLTYLTNRFSVSPASVISYASSPPFETNAGVVRESASKKQSFKRPQDTAGFFRRKDSWIYRLRLNPSHFKGFSVPMPVAFGSILDIHYGDKGTLISPLGPQNYSWVGLSPQSGTIRRFVEKNNWEVGDLVFLIFGDDGTFNVEKISDSGENALEQALCLIGRSPNLQGNEALEEFSSAIMLSRSAQRSTVISSYKEKGDDKIYELLLESHNSLPDALKNEDSVQSEPKFFDISKLL